MDAGVAGATSASLAATGADIAKAEKTGPHRARPEYSPKGFTSRKRTLGVSRTTVPPRPPAVGALAEPVATTNKVNYHYSSAYQYVESDGTYANLVIGRPYLAAEDYHSLAEIAVQSADGKQIVEVGWTVDRGVNGDEDPHLFVYHWVDGKESCYNGCGFKQYSKTVVPGDTLPTGVPKRFGIQFYNGAWWIAYDSEWVGYFPGELWEGRYTKSGLIQWFGEVAASSIKPCTDMGTGADAFDLSAARAGSISLINGPEVSISVRANSPEAEAPVYGANRLSERTFRYGGPGAC
ncbi:MAG TPA: neprosin family prolyl endopeptidase [Actinoplanes sp.]|nr:neprosin family prolyl endopeptidase [Actinoplanes sp.]